MLDEIERHRVGERGWWWLKVKQEGEGKHVLLTILDSDGPTLEGGVHQVVLAYDRLVAMRPRDAYVRGGHAAYPYRAYLCKPIHTRMVLMVSSNDWFPRGDTTTCTGKRKSDSAVYTSGWYMYV